MLFIIQTVNLIVLRCILALICWFLECWTCTECVRLLKNYKNNFICHLVISDRRSFNHLAHMMPALNMVNSRQSFGRKKGRF